MTPSGLEGLVSRIALTATPSALAFSTASSSCVGVGRDTASSPHTGTATAPFRTRRSLSKAG